MSKPPIMMNTSVLTEKEKEEALVRVKRQMADEWAKSELGMSPGANVPVQKGPASIPDEEQCPITLNLYEGTDRIVLDGVVYLHGHTYTVGKRTFDTLAEIISRGWGHQRNYEGKNENDYRYQQNISAETGQPRMFRR